ncbi:MAG TPA: hypothetical protein ENJ29_04165 [Bacteroidetes bacterium]|nr:hypothetical protein [Bacteroidota bacterium]
MLKKLPFFTLLFFAACAGSDTGGKKQVRGTANVITAEEISTSTVITPSMTVYNAIEYLRPLFLRPRSVAGLSNDQSEPVVYIDRIKRGGLEVLQNLYITDVEEIRYLSPSEATFQFGTNHATGAILIKSRTR